MRKIPFRSLFLLLIFILISACTPGNVETSFSASPTVVTQPEIADSTQPIPTQPASVTSVTTDTDLHSVSEFPDPTSYEWQLVTDALQKPVNLAHAGDGSNRIFIVEKAGVIRILVNGVLVDTPFLDITNRVGSQQSEQGLLGLAFHPNFKENGYLYVNYTARDGNTVIARFQVDPVDAPEGQTADPNSEQVILRVNQPYANHNGGHLLFGPDGMLWLGLGDGGSAGDPQNNAQSPESLLGKLLRIDVDRGDSYSIPDDNPFADGGGLPEIWALGLRNPWSFSFDSVSGDLYIADVGQEKWEEINVVPTGFNTTPLNFGWRNFEGTENYSNADPGSAYVHTPPIHVYGHDQGCSVTGGLVSRGTTLPDFNGVYLFGDFCSGTIWGMLQSDAQTWQVQRLFSTQYKITAFGADEMDEIYLLDLQGGLYKLTQK